MGLHERGTINPYKFYNLRKVYSFREIAEMVGYTKDGLYHWCRRNGVEVKRVTDWEILEALKANKSVKEIAFEYNINVKTIYSRIQKISEGGRK